MIEFIQGFSVTIIGLSVIVTNQTINKLRKRIEKLENN